MFGRTAETRPACRGRAAAPALAALMALGCGSDASEDLGPARDAAVADLGVRPDRGGPPRPDIGPPDPPDMGLACDVRVCDPRDDTACGSGSIACVLWSMEPACRTADGEGLEGQACDAVEDCAEGLACFRGDDTEPGVCGVVCCPGAGDGVCESRDLGCGGAGVLVDGTETTWGRCLPPRPCDVFAPEAFCEPREACYIDEERLLTECRVSGSASAGDACEVPEDCEPGLHCSSLARVCITICEIEAPEDFCADGQRCVAQAHSPEGTGFCTR